MVLLYLITNLLTYFGFEARLMCSYRVNMLTAPSRLRPAYLVLVDM